MLNVTTLKITYRAKKFTGLYCVYNDGNVSITFNRTRWSVFERWKYCYCQLTIGLESNKTPIKCGRTEPASLLRQLQINFIGQLFVFVLQNLFLSLPHSANLCALPHSANLCALPHSANLWPYHTLPTCAPFIHYICTSFTAV